MNEKLPMPTLVCPGCRSAGKSKKHCPDDTRCRCRWRECACGTTFNTETGFGFKEPEDAE